MSTKWLTIASLLVVIGVVLGFFLWSRRWHAGMVSGDVKASDSGFWSYPRYKITFPTLESSQVVAAQFIVAGLPPAPLTFALEVLETEAGGAQHANLAMADCLIAVGIRDGEGNTLREVSDRASKWHSTESLGHFMFWHEALRDIRFNSREEYTVTIDIDCAQGDISTIVVEPQLSGGGNELP